MEENKDFIADELDAEEIGIASDVDEINDTPESNVPADEAIDPTVENDSKEEPETPEEGGKTSRTEKKKNKKAEAELNEMKKMLESIDKEHAELNDKYMRLCAEYDNFRKRSAKEREGIYSDACFEVLAQILPILDTLERAAQYNTEADAESPMGKGLTLTLKSFIETLEKLGVHEIEALGKPFDPNFHNAVMHIDDENFGENEIVEVFMKGYAKGDKVLRYSMVKVAN